VLKFVFSFLKSNPMHGDLCFSEVFESCHKQQGEHAAIVHYFSNLPYSEVLDARRSNKYPGTMVTSLMRKNLRLFSGQHTQHKAYKPDEIEAWMQPVQRRVPPLYFVPTNVVMTTQTQNTYPPPPPAAICCSPADIDFGPEDSTTFDIVPDPVYVCRQTIDFGHL
jgi:hypothetical protein